MKTKGTIVWNPKGYAFLIREDGNEDIFIKARDLSGALHGDTVEADFFKRGKGFSGRVTKILRRENLNITGKYIRFKKWGEIEPSKPMPYTITVPRGWEAAAKHNDMVKALIVPPKSGGRRDALSAKVESVLSLPDNIGDDLKYIISKHGLPFTFSAEAEEEASTAADIDINEYIKDRIDLRDRVLFTIDGRKARDFDDAVGIESLPDRNFLLTVAIADVAELVKPGSALDREALDRGFSVYFPESCLPMLPESLSNGMLSLKPYEDRLAVAVEMKMGPRGKLISTRCFEAVIRSRARLMYETASPFLEEKAGPPVKDRKVINSLVNLKRLAFYLYGARKKAGSLDFDLPEVEIEVSENGQVEDISKRPRGPAERLIEEMMLLANRAVCAYLRGKSAPVLYRVHDKPSQDDILELITILEELGCNKKLTSKLYQAGLNGAGLNMALNGVADAYRGHELEGFVHRHILRSLRQAEYSSEDIGHFGLAFTGYLHFTSPIRRYSDLLVHRILKGVIRTDGITEKDKSKTAKNLKKLAGVISKKERLTNEAMMEAVKLKTASYMKRHVGERFTGIVTGILPFGFFVELPDPPVDGLVRTSNMRGVKIIEGNSIRLGRKVIFMGDKVEVIIARVDETRGFIDMELSKSSL